MAPKPALVCCGLNAEVTKVTSGPLRCIPMPVVLCVRSSIIKVLTVSILKPPLLSEGIKVKRHTLSSDDRVRQSSS